MLPKFKIGDVVRPDTYKISGDIFECWRSGRQYTYLVVFEDWPAEEFEEDELKKVGQSLSSFVAELAGKGGE